MKEFLGNLQGYLQLNISNIKWIFMIGFFFYVLFHVLEERRGISTSSKLISIFCQILLALNCSTIFVLTLLRREKREEYFFSFIPFESYRSVLTEGNMEVLLQIIMNIVMYIPLGFLLPCYFQVFTKHRYILLLAIISSLTIELIQLLFKIGLFEVDDIINNTLGTIIGVLIYILSSKMKQVLNRGQR